MATTNTTNGIQLQQGIAYTRVFYFGTTGQTVVVKISKGGAAGVTATNSPATEIDSTNVPGFYKINLTSTDLNTPGDLAFVCTAGAGGPAAWTDQVVTQLFSSL